MGRYLYAWKMTAGLLYQSALRAELAPLGLAWQVKRNGLGELRDIPNIVLRAFSKRRVDIEAAMDRGGFTSSKAAETATPATRQRKPDSSLPADVLRESWSVQLAEIDLPDGDGGRRPAEVADITSAIGQHLAVPPTASQIEAVMKILAGEKGVSLDEWEIDEDLAPDARAMYVTLFGSTFSRRDALRAVARAFDVTPDEVAAITNQLLERDSVVRVLADPGAGPEATRTKSGHVVPATSGDRRYTTTELLAAEARIIDSAKRGIGLG